MRVAIAGALWALLLAACTALKPGDQADTPHSDTARVYHGLEVREPYSWLEDMDAERTRRWARAQDRRTRAALAGDAREAPRERVLEAASVRRYLPPIERGGRYFYVTGRGGFARASVSVQRGLDGEPRKLVDAQTLAASGRRLHRRVWPSPHGRRLAYATSAEGSRWLSLHIHDLREGTTREAVLEGLVAGSSRVAWSPDGGSLYYEQFERPASEERQRATLRGERLRRHRLDTPQSADTTIYTAPDPSNDFLTTALSHDGRFLVVTVRDGRQRNERVLVMNRSTPERELQELASLPEASYRFVGGHGSTIWLQTDHDAPRGRIIGVDPADADNRRTLIPQRGATIDTWIGAKAVGRGLVVGYRYDGRLVLDYFDADGHRLRRLRPPNLGSIWTGLYGRPGSDEAFYTVSNFANPGTVYRLDLATGERHVFRRPDLPYDPGAIVVEQRFYTNDQGRRVPLYLAYHRDTPPNGERPMMMYGYGFGGWIPSPWFRSHLPAWFRMGGSFVLPALRGDGTYGAEWHEAGTGTRQGHSIADYLAAAEWLIAEGLVRPGRLVAEANSAGAPVAAMAVLRRPERFGALILAFPLLDLINYERYTHATRWRSELGSVEDPEQFKTLRRLSPVHNAQPGRCYPPTLLIPGAKDEVTPPMHAYKFAAALRDAQACDNPVRLRVSWQAGHGYGATAEASAANFADQLGFLRRAMSLDE